MGDDMATYIEKFISPLYTGSYKCISMTWAPTFEDTVTYLKQLTKGETYPDGIVLNAGLHPSMHSDMPEMNEAKVGLNRLIALTNNIVEDKKIRFLYHSPTYVDETA